MPYKSINIVTWNANGISGKIDEFKHFLTTHKIDICIVNETKIVQNTKLKFQNYIVHRKDGTLRGGGLAILVKKGIKHTLMPEINTQITQLTIKLNSTLISGCYAKPYLPMNKSDLDNIFAQGNKIVVIGDLNCRHVTWNNDNNNKNGLLLHDYIIDNNLQLLYTSTPTHYPYNNTTPTYIDIVLNKNVLDLPDPLVLDELSSDHRPLLLKWRADVRTEDVQITYSYKNVNWRRFREIVNDRVTINSEINSPMALDTEVDKLTEALQEARNKTAKKIRFQNKEDTLPQHILDMIKHKNAVRRLWQRTRRRQEADQVRQLTVEIKNAIVNHKNDAWTAALRGLSTRDNSLWTLTRRVKKKHNPTPPIDGENDNKGRADALARQFAGASSNAPNTSNEQKTITDIVNTITKQKYPIPPPMLHKLAYPPRQVLTLIQTLPIKQSPRRGWAA